MTLQPRLLRAQTKAPRAKRVMLFVLYFRLLFLYLLWNEPLTLSLYRLLFLPSKFYAGMIKAHISIIVCGGGGGGGGRARERERERGGESERKRKRERVGKRYRL